MRALAGVDIGAVAERNGHTKATMRFNRSELEISGGGHETAAVPGQSRGAPVPPKP